VNCGIYQIENTVNGKRYVGSSNQVARRFYLHKWDLKRGQHHSVTLQRSWDKYGEAAFRFRVLLYCSVAMLHFYEQRCLDEMGTVDPAKGFNICCDAASAGTGRVWTDEQKQAKSLERKGKKMSPDVHARYLATRKDGADHPFYGKHHTEETRNKISISRSGTPAWNKGKHTGNNQAKITPEQVLEIRMLKSEGMSRKEIAPKYGLKPNTIWRICSGKNWPNVGGLS
jgi:group I intron endonuclease